ncbi:TonB-dependent receptor [Wenyingzhuangia aestuarii]|uniref:TonB-dependent receptor n=1 Tax=Wenyingzhuangia aestuarii TaxID=1647582 RepID=UPI00143CAC13|nr:TonB-dependent receptor [Wenyingzhuangia aestuarii]NJB83728.1 outer membrane receptor protein involved in Fe transport [Wenyingzhuangia aestuarii]
MKKTIQVRWGFLLVMLFSASSIIAQTTISGNVTDQNGEPLLGISVLLKGTGKGSVSDFNGNYTIINVKNGNYILEASSIGYTNYTKKLNAQGGNLVQNFVMNADAQSLDEIIITGVATPKSKIESSVSVTTMKPSVITQSAPRSTAEIFRTIPGIRAESSGGEGNSNIAVRGVPISSGGSKYVQLQEDGLPVLLYGDIAFGTSDIFTRFDNNVAKIEAIRGGSASTLTSNGPGGIINIISKTGENEGGSIGTTFGVDYNSFRTDFDYGTEVSNNLFLHAGGFYRAGEGIRSTGFTANNGGQLKMSLTKKFENGRVRLYAKYLNDRTAAYMPVPIKVTGTNSNPTWENAPGFNATTGSIHTANLTQTLRTGADGATTRGSVTDGMHPISTSLGFEASFDLDNDWKITNNGRFSMNKGSFVTPFVESVGTANDMAVTLGGPLTFAANGNAVDGNTLVSRIHMFDVELNNFNNFMNDVKLSKTIENVSITAGYFKSIQNVSMSWLWNTYVQDATDNNAKLINVGTLSENGLLNYGTPAWGNLQRNYDTQYNVSAPYAHISVDATDDLTIDASVRYDMGSVSGSFAGGKEGAIDVNGDGTISTPEQTAHVVDNANPTAVDYDYNYISYSAGINYKFSDNQSIFARYSKGASAKADRILFSGLDYLDGDKINALDFLSQAEIGFKRNLKRGAVYATAFYATTNEEGGFEASSNSIIENDYKSMGVEIEGFYNFGDFNLRGAVTYTKAEITSGANKGNKPRRQPDVIYNLMPSYNFGTQKQNSIGLSFVGQSKAYAQDSNELVMPSFVVTSGFINYAITKSLNANFSVNNIFDSIAVTEAEEGSITNNQVNYVRARTLPGRSMSLALKYQF